MAWRSNARQGKKKVITAGECESYQPAAVYSTSEQRARARINTSPSAHHRRLQEKPTLTRNIYYRPALWLYGPQSSNCLFVGLVLV